MAVGSMEKKYTTSGAAPDIRNSKRDALPACGNSLPSPLPSPVDLSSKGSLQYDGVPSEAKSNGRTAVDSKPVAEVTPASAAPTTQPHESIYSTTSTNGAGDKPTVLPVSPVSTEPPKSPKTQQANGVRRLSATKIAELTESLPIAAILEVEHQPSEGKQLSAVTAGPAAAQNGVVTLVSVQSPPPDICGDDDTADGDSGKASSNGSGQTVHRDELGMHRHWNSTGSLRTLSTTPISRQKLSSTQNVAANVAAARRHSHNTVPRPPPLHFDGGKVPPVGSANVRRDPSQPQQKLEPPPQGHGEYRLPSPIPPSIPLPPMSLPTLLQLELAGERPSPLYIHHSQASDIPYESNAVKFERLRNFLLLPTYLERTMYFGALACLDAWLWTLTILPIRFWVAFSVLVRWWAYVVGKEVRWLTAYVWRGLGRMWQRGRQPRPTPKQSGSTDNVQENELHNDASSEQRPRERAHTGSASDDNSFPFPTPATKAEGNGSRSSRRRTLQTPSDAATTTTASGISSARAILPRSTQKIPGHRRTKSMPSNLTSFHKADLLQGAVILCSCIALMKLDASRMYHFIRAQSAVKLYVIYNLVEVGDRLLSAVGQDVFECLFSTETLSRTASGRSKLLLPFGMFLLSLVYNIAHTVVLFYQVITLNVAVNSYSNALLSLLMSNQFVEVKSSVFKRTEKENTFQLACADIVERFQLWIVLFIIAMRNIVEIGGLSVPGTGAGFDLGNDDVSTKVPLHNTSILPASFTILPSWLVSVEVLSPFLIVIGSEMIVDWIKHGYINKFNNIKSNFYSRILDILCKDYYTNAFVTPALTRRLGLPLIPLCTLFLRSSVQTYHMFLATHLPSPLPPSTHTSLIVESATPSSPAMAASLERLDTLIRNALGRAVYGNPYSTGGSEGSAPQAGLLGWSSDDIIAGITMIVVFFIAFLVLLILKLLLGMALLRYSRNRYARMKLQEISEATGKAEPEVYETTGKRTGGFGKVEVGEDRRRWIFHDDPEGLKKLREKERRDTGKGKKEIDLNSITRYEMIAKRIW